MINDFNKELYLINSNNCIIEKLMVYLLYDEFKKEIIFDLDDYSIKNFLYVMEKTFESIAVRFNAENNNIDAEQFMKFYFEMLKKNVLYDTTLVNKNINKFKKKIKLIINDNGYINIIEKMPISFFAKYNIMIQFKEYIDKVYSTIIYYYGEISSNDLKINVFNMLSISLENHLNDCIRNGYTEQDIINNLKDILISFTKNYFVKEMINDKSSLNNFNDNSYKLFFNSLKDFEQKLVLYGVICDISGYDYFNKSIKENQTKEICKLLNISELKFKLTALSLSIRAIRHGFTEENHNSEKIIQERKKG